jgi:hypothetical protein
MNKSDQEREKILKEMSKKVMPLVGELLDIFDNVPNDIKSDEELEELFDIIDQISEIMDDDSE